MLRAIYFMEVTYQWKIENTVMPAGRRFPKPI